ncbi:uncharacterized protein LOC119689737 [Teleopsis dalmanni]|uniref:uncharacterized protein LOC119689737 n=1 Tax=Teleopsis dalmanni TaxID=139649 RepID=UPI0018CDF129|nr:uncharacterized protein LOC119689737 [Teleopsis dalmanni]
MLSTQQLIKALCKLQSNIGNSDLMNILKHAANTTTALRPAVMTSLLTAHDVTSSTSSTHASSSTLLSTSPKQQKQQATDSSQQQNEDNCEIIHTVNFSLVPHSDESGAISSSVKNANTQDLNTAPIATAVTSATTKNNLNLYVNHSQQIQKFYRQQQQHQQQFHTQQNQSLYAKQKQTQFAMSSLAAEPLVLKQDDIVATNGSNDCCISSSENGGNITKQKNNSSSSTSGKPCFSTGLGDILQFMELIGNLKHTKRTGWVLRDVNDCESISGHMYRMSMMTFLLDGSEGLNQIRCMELALVHDLAESLVGDITPFCGVSKEEKRALEFKAMADICKLIEPRGKRIMELFEEYEQGESPESKFVKDLDRLDMVMQAFEYEKRDNCLLKHQEFFDSTEGKFNHPFVKKLVNEIYEQRQVLANAKGATPPPSINVPNSDLPTENGICSDTITIDDQKKSSKFTSS